MDVSPDQIVEARARICRQVYQTPVMTSRTLNARSGATLFFKCENLQRAGAFKFRGASNAVLSLPDTVAAKGVATHSSGNHAGALALAARLRGIPAYVVMPENAPAVKVAAVKEYGGRITFCKPTLQAREETLAQVQRETGATFIHPYDNALVIAGQGTAMMEILEQVPHVDTVIAPVGGGGLLSGTALAASGSGRSISVIGAEPAGADDAYRSLRDGFRYPSENPVTIADGLLTALSDRTFRLIREHADTILTVSEDAIVRSMRLVWERMKLVIEPSSAVVLAAVMEHAERFEGRHVVGIFSGGNVDLDHLPWSGREVTS